MGAKKIRRGKTYEDIDRENGICSCGLKLRRTYVAFEMDAFQIKCGHCGSYKTPSYAIYLCPHSIILIIFIFKIILIA